MLGPDFLALSCAVLILIAGLAFSARLSMGGWRKKVSSRIGQVTSFGGGPAPAEARNDLFRILDGERGRGLLARLGGALRETLRPVGGMKALRTIVLMALLAGGLCFVFGQRVLGLSLLVNAGIALVFAIATPIYYVSGQLKRQRERFLDNFPDAIDLIVRAVRAGIPTSESIVAAGREFGEPVGTEFARIGQEIAIGLTPDRALTEAAERIRISDFNFFVVTLILQRETGGNLAETLENLSSLLRKRREMRLKVRALTAEGRFTSKIISGLPFLIMLALFFLNKRYVTLLFTDPAAQTYLGIALGLIVVGSALLNRMIKLDV